MSRNSESRKRANPVSPGSGSPGKNPGGVVVQGANAPSEKASPRGANGDKKSAASEPGGISPRETAAGHPSSNKPPANIPPARKKADPQPKEPVTQTKKTPQEVEEKSDFLTDLWLRFKRFGWDIAGVTLIALALITLIGFINPNPEGQGFLLAFWVSTISRFFGWGWILVIASMALLGLLCLRMRFSQLPRIPLGRILAFEGLAFSLLTLLAILGGFSLENVEAGGDGGIVGWGLATLLDRVLPLPWSTMLVVLLMILFAGYGFGLIQWTHRQLEKWLDTINPGGVGTPVIQRTQAVPPVQPPPAVVPATPVPGQTSRRRADLPPLTLLLDEHADKPDEEKIKETGEIIEHTLSEFGVPARVVGYRVGPTVTQFAVEPGFVEKPGPDGEMTRQKVRVSQISGLSRDLALHLSAERLRIEAPVPGHSYVGVEVPNQRVSIVRMRSLLESEAFTRLSSPLAFVLGRDVSGQPVVADLARMPHLLIAGTTGSGKSICIESITTCLAMNNTPDDLRLALLDPKMVELTRFNGLPHMFGKVETQVDRMLGVLRWALNEMDRRYRLLEEAPARDIIAYNNKMAKRGQPGLPRIVVIVDELADLMMTAAEQTEHSLIRLAQMARATGIHLIVATQRPSTDVVTGLIKANFPARLAFAVASSIDSRVILDTNGAESLLGKGDMLFLNPEAGTPLRAQGVLVTDPEIDAVLNFWKEKMKASGQSEAAAPWEGLIEAAAEEENSDKLVQQAIQVVRQTQRASASLLQRRLRIGYPRAARLMDELEELGVVGPSMGGGRERDVLLEPEAGKPVEDSEEESEA